MTAEFDKLAGVGELSQSDRDLVKRLACDLFNREFRGSFPPQNAKDERATVIRCLKEALISVKAVSAVFKDLESALETT